MALCACKISGKNDWKQKRKWWLEWCYVSFKIVAAEALFFVMGSKGFNLIMIYDITPMIESDIAVWPGDLKFKRIIRCDMESGNNITLSGIESTVHLGAHADAPNHFCKQGKSIGECDLDPYVGLCQVIKCD